MLYNPNPFGEISCFRYSTIKNSLMKYVLLIWALYASLNAYSQDCTQALASQKPGIWKEGMKGSVSGIPTADLDKERKVVTAIHLLVKSKYSPIGVEADYNGSYDRPDTEVPVNIYDYNIYFLHYICEGNIIKTDHETSTSLSVSANRFDAKIYEKPDENNLPGEGFYSMKKMPVEKDGNYYFEENADLGMGVTGKSRIWLITYDNKLPFIYVTKREFLEKQKNMLILAMPHAIGSSRDNLKTKTEQDFKKALEKIEILMKMPSSESGQPAIVKQDPNDYLSYLFTSGDDAFGKVLIKPNPAYFNSKLPKSSPQFFVVNITGNEKEPVAAKVMTDVIKDMDFTALRNMLGK
jgi:hypothetical protein